MRAMVTASRWPFLLALGTLILSSCGDNRDLQSVTPSPQLEPAVAASPAALPPLAATEPATPTPTPEPTPKETPSAVPTPSPLPSATPVRGLGAVTPTASATPAGPGPTPTNTPPPQDASPTATEASDGDTETITLTASPDPVSPRGTITVQWKAPKGHSSFDWIALYTADASNEDYGEWYSTDESSGGSLTFTAPAEEGVFEVRYLLDGGYDDASRAAFTTAYPSPGSEEYALSVASQTVGPGGPMNVTWTAPESHSTYDSIGLYEVGSPDAEYLDWQYAQEGATGTLTFAMPQTLGEYEFRYLVNGVSPVTASDKVTATLPWCSDSYTLTALPDSLGPDDEVTVRWSAPPDQPLGAWIGLFKAGSTDGQSVTFQYTRGDSCGSLSFLPPTIPGEYEFRYIVDRRGGSQSVSNPVTAATPAFLADLGWVADGVDEDEETAFELLYGLADASPALASTVADLPWLADGVTVVEREVVRELNRLAEADADVASTVAALAWLVDGAGPNEDDVVYRVALFAAHDGDLAVFIATLPWVADGTTPEERDALADLSTVVGLDFELGTSVAALSWFADGITIDESEGIDNLAFLARKDPVMARNIADSDWFAESMTAAKASLIHSVSDLVLDDYALATELVNNPLLVEGLPETQLTAIQQIETLRQIDPGLAGAALALPWVTEGMTDEKLWALVLFNSIAARDTGLAGTLLNIPWFVESMSDEKLAALSLFSFVADKDPSLAGRLAGMPFFTGSFEEHDVYALHTLFTLYENGLDSDVTLLSTQDWFVDGLSDEEALFVSVLRTPAQFAISEFRSLVAAHYTDTRTISLPLAGDVDLTIIRMSPYVVGNAGLGQLADAIGVIESFMGVAFPKKEVALLYASTGPPGTGRLGANTNTHILVDPKYDQDSNAAKYIVAHEIAHYYWGTDLSEGITVAQPWLLEGVSEFLADYVFDQAYDVPLERFIQETEASSADCFEMGITTLAQLVDTSLTYQEHETTPSFNCNYHLGERFLLGIQDIIGLDAFARAWKDLYLISKSEEHRGKQLTEEEIYTSFLGHVAQDRVGGFQQFYELWHGGDFSD